MRILLVGNYALDFQSSMQRYADMLCREMTTRGHTVEVIRPKAFLGRLTSRQSIRRWLGYVDKYVIFPTQLRVHARGFDIVHICDHSNSMYMPHVGGRPVGITCHDLLGIGSAMGRYPGRHVSSTGKLQQRWILRHLALAQNVVCVSAHTAREFQEICRRDGQTITVIPNALNFQWERAPNQLISSLRRRLNLADDEQYIFHIGGDLWYKNRLGVLRIFNSFRKILRTSGRAELRLVLAGHSMSGEMRNYISSEGLSACVVEATNLSNEDVCTLYSGAVALLFPSLQEGFGWPLIEAQSCGCPVITSNRSPMTEVAGESALFIDPDAEEEAAAIIAAGLNDLHLLRQGGFENAQKFSPAQVMPLYEKFFIEVNEGTACRGIN